MKRPWTSSRSAARQAGVVGLGVDPEVGQRRRVRLGALAGGGVDDARLGLAHRPQHHRLALLVVLAVALDLQVQVGPVEAAHHQRRVAQVQPLDDLLPDRRGGGGGEREHRRVAELVHDLPQPQVVGAEVVPPRRHAVRLVHHEQRRLGRGELLDDLGLGQLLGGEEDELDRAGAQPVERPPPAPACSGCCWPPPRRRSPRGRSAPAPGRAAGRSAGTPRRSGRRAAAPAPGRRRSCRNRSA